MTTQEMQLRQAMATPGFQLIMARLSRIADAMQANYDKINFVTEPDRAMHIQITRDVINTTIPAIMEKIMNSDKPEAPWSFKAWLRGVLTVAVLCLAVTAQAVGPMPKDGDDKPVQGYAINGLYTAILTSASTTIDLRQDIWWGIYAPLDDCKFRLSPAAAKTGLQTSVPSGTLFGSVVSKATPYLNYSGAGCVGAVSYRSRP